MATPGILCGGHGPFAWGKNPMNAVYHASVLERCAEMAYFTEQISGKNKFLNIYLTDTILGNMVKMHIMARIMIL